jgi:hypothetical protein
MIVGSVMVPFYWLEGLGDQLREESFIEIPYARPS